MNKRGFTLIELIGVIVLISIMVLIIVPTVDKVIKRGQTTADSQLESNILLAAQNWAADNKKELSKLQTNWSYNLLISTLKEQGYIDKNIILPSTKEEYTNNCVKITKVSNAFEKKAIYDYEVELNNPMCILEFTDFKLSIKGKEDIANGKTLSSGQWTKENVKLTAIDETNSKIASGTYFYLWNEISTTSNEKVIKANANEAKKETYSVQMKAEGRITQASDNFIVAIDKKSPSITVSFKYDGANVIKMTIDETGQSGLPSQNILYAVSKTQPTTYNTMNISAGAKKELTIPNNVIKALTTGNYYLWIKEGIKDNVGNLSKARKIGPIAIDNTAPICTVSGGNANWTNASRTITAKCSSDTGGSGCKTSDFSKNYNTQINTTTAGAIDNNKGGTVEDKAGNIANCSANQTVRVDKTRPSVTFSPNTKNSIKVSSGQQVSVTIKDQQSGLKAKQKIYYAWSSSNKTEPSYTKSITTTNNAGNTSTTITIPASDSANFTSPGNYYLWIKSGISDVSGNTSLASVSQVFSFDTYTITLNPNGGSVSPTTLDVKYNSTYNLPTPSRSGYTFLGWFPSTYNGYTFSSWDLMNYYADKYSDLKAAFGHSVTKLMQHWVDYGKKEGRTNSPFQSGSTYTYKGNITLHAEWGTYGSSSYWCGTYSCNCHDVWGGYYSCTYQSGYYTTSCEVGYWGGCVYSGLFTSCTSLGRVGSTLYMSCPNYVYGPNSSCGSWYSTQCDTCANSCWHF